MTNEQVEAIEAVAARIRDVIWNTARDEGDPYYVRVIKPLCILAARAAIEAYEAQELWVLRASGAQYMRDRIFAILEDEGLAQTKAFERIALLPLTVPRPSYDK